MAVDSDSGFLQWVVDGTLVENASLELLRNNSANKPTDLTGKIVLGAFQWAGSKEWIDYWLSNQVSNLNIFSRFLSVEEMKENTKGDKCSSEGDYLAWTKLVLSMSLQMRFAKVTLL